MPRKTKPLTHTEVDKAKPKEKDYPLADGDGLKLLVKAIGSKLWLFDYYHPITKKRALMSFGAYPEVSLAMARELRAKCRKLVAQGIDPKQHRDDQRREAKLELETTLKAVAEQWFELKRDQVTADYADDIWRSLEGHIFPSIGNTPIKKISAPLVIEVLDPIAAKGNLETVKRLCQRLNEIMIWGINTGVLQQNPIAGIRNNFRTPKKQNMPTLRPEELPELMRALNTASIKLTTRCLIEWQLHTLSRPSEAAGARWTEIDEVNNVWRIPAERMKKRRDHTVPLTTSMFALLDLMRPISGHREFIFPADRNPRSHANEQTANMALKRMGFKGRLVAHGLRSMGSTALNEEGFPFDLIEAALAHSDKDDVRQTYNRAEYIERRRPLMAWWSDFINRAATGNMSLAGEPNKVINLKLLKE